MKYRKYNEYHRVENGIEQKQCEDCLNWFDMNEINFGNVKTNKDGFNHKCRKCKKEHGKKYYEENREHIIEQSTNWIKNNYEQFNQTRKNSYFKTDKFKDWMKRNFVQKRQRMKEWRKENPDKCKEYVLKRNLHKTHEITDEELEMLYEYADDKCMFCDMSEEYSKYLYGERLHREHAINNGSNGIDNCILSCKGCNSSKHTKDWDEWFTPDNPIYNEVNYNKIKEWLDNFNELI